MKRKYTMITSLTLGLMIGCQNGATIKQNTLKKASNPHRENKKRKTTWSSKKTTTPTVVQHWFRKTGIPKTTYINDLAKNVQHFIPY